MKYSFIMQKWNLCLGLLLLIIIDSGLLQAQIVTLSPANPTANQEVTVTFDATKGTGLLAGASKVYMHSGVITSSPAGTDWQNVIGNWGMDDSVGIMETAGTNLWKITFSPSIRAYHNAPVGENIFRLAMVFRNADGSVKGTGTPGAINGGQIAANGDIFMELNVPVYISITSPVDNNIFISQGDSILFRAEPSSLASSIKLLIDEGSGFNDIASAANASSLSYYYKPVNSLSISLKAQAVIDTKSVESSKDYNIRIVPVTNISDLPAGVIPGINYIADSTHAILCLEAPHKDFVYAVGDFSDWALDDRYLMHKTTDGEKFWIEIDSLIPHQEYAFQYWVNGSIKIGDPYADKTLDPWNDGTIPESVYPGLILYNKKENGIATVIQTAQAAYPWPSSEQTFTRPNKKDLAIYELLVRDFLGSHDYKDLADTLTYLKRLGFNAIELMPIMEFEGNESWGYNPSYFFAPDKYYGTKNDLKAFIWKAHSEGIAVILDMVLNHAFGQCPLVEMYWNSSANIPSADNPWFNQHATHPFSVGFDFNHESLYTQRFVDSVNSYWIKEYHFDGFRFDLSKGFTQTYNPDNVSAWGAYDASRIAILERMAGRIWDIDSNAYVILEHFAASQEESELAADGMMLWRNLSYPYGIAVAGNTQAVNFLGADGSSFISYMESHDEERLMYKAISQGAKLNSYDIKNPYIALYRVKMGAAFFYLVPGPKMLWQFQELGYDISIDYNGRLGNKPLPWGSGNLEYYENFERQKLYRTIQALRRLVNDYHQVFRNGTFDWSTNSALRRLSIVHPDLNLCVVGNFDVKEGQINGHYTKTGTWYDFFNSGSQVAVNNLDTLIKLAPGEFHVYVDRVITWPDSGLVEPFKPVVKTDPAEFTASETVHIIFNASNSNPAGTSGLAETDTVYMVSGVILNPMNPTTWSNQVGSVNLDDGVGRMTKVNNDSNQWEITIVPRTYFSVPATQRIFKIGMYFRNPGGTKLGKGPGGENIYLDVLPDPDLKVLTTDPLVFTAGMDVKIIFDASLADPAGTPGLIGVDKVYMHAGIITDSPTGTSWQNVIGNWGMDDGIGLMTKTTGSANKWEITINPMQYFNAAASTKIYRLGMVFRNSNGSREGKDTGGTDFFIQVAQSLDALDPSQEEEFVLLYPNPARDYVCIKRPELSGKINHISICNISGQIVTDRIFPEPVSQFEFNVSGYRPGLYLMRISTGNKFITRKFIVRH